MLLTDYELAVCSETADLIVNSYEEYNFDVEDYFTRFFNSEIGKKMDIPYSKYQYLMSGYVNDEFLRYINTTNKPLKFANFKYNKDILYWIGFLVRYWNFLYHRNISQFIKLFDFKTLYDSYSLHILSIEMAIEKLYEKYEIENKLTLLDIKEIKRVDSEEIGSHFLLDFFNLID